MSHKILLGLCFSVLLLRAGAGGTKEVNGTLGESIIFQVKASPSFKTISWTKSVDNIARTIAVVTFGEPCGLQVLFPAYLKRVSISKDCRELHLSQLEKEDAGRYTAGIVLSTSETMDESFDLRIFRRLLTSEMRVTCTPGGTKNETWKLNCSTGTWDDGVNFVWSPDVQGKGPTPGSSVMIVQDLDLNVTCIARNPVSNASKTVSVKQVCAEETNGTEAPQVNGNKSANTAVIVGVIVPLIILLFLIAVAVYVWKRKAAKRCQSFVPHSGTKSPPRSDSRLIGDQPKETRRNANQPATKAATNKEEMPNTVYTFVQHPKQNHLQTDDEKMQKGRPQNQEEKTIYSEISKSQESEDPNIKTIYETVKKPLPVKSAGMSDFV